MFPRRLTGICLLWLSAPTSHALGQALTAPVQGSVDVGSALLSQPGLTGSGVFTLASQLRYAGLRGSVASSGVVALTPSSRFTGQGLVAGSVFAPPLQRLRWELGAMASIFGLSDASTTASWQLLAREHLSVGRGALFAGAGGGASVRDQLSRSVFVGQLGGLLPFDPFGRDQLSSAVTFTSAQTFPSEDIAIAAAGASVVTAFSDLSAFWDHDGARLELSAGGGVRVGVRNFGGERVIPWGSASATWWVVPRLGVVASGGRALADVARGVPTVKYLSLAMRIGFSGRAAPSLTASRERPPDEDGEPRLAVTIGDGDSRVIAVHVRAAASVEIMADFTSWEPVSLARDSATADRWTLARPIAPGSHRVALRVDGGAWSVPANLPRVADDFGGFVGLLTVP